MFFKSTRFKVLLIIVLCLSIVSFVFGNFTNWSAPQSNIVGAIIKPAQKLSMSISNSFEDFFTKLKSADKYEAEKKVLQDKINKLTSDLLDYQKAIEQNKFYKSFFELKDQNPDFKLLPASLIARDPSDKFGTFTIDKGVLDGVSLYDPVITSEGLVGYISEALTNESVIMTILNPKFNVSAVDRRTRDAGNIGGTSELAAIGKCKLSYLPRSNSAAEGDYIVSGGSGGIFPEGLLIGTIEEIKQDQQNISLFATVIPAAQMNEIRDVMIITSFNGQSNITDQKAGK